MSTKHTPLPSIPAPNGRTRAEYMADLMSDGTTTLGTAMAIADAAGKLHGYRLTHEQVYAIMTALAAARLALADEGDAAALIRADALVRVNDACAAVRRAVGGEAIKGEST